MFRPRRDRRAGACSLPVGAVGGYSRPTPTGREQNDELLGEDWWPYSVSANRTALDTFLRYHHEQGLSARRWTVEEIIAPDLLDT